MIVETLELFFDLDDTLFNTHFEFRKYLLEDYGFVAPVDQYLTLANTGGLVQHVLNNPLFMLTTEPFECKLKLMREIKHNFKDRVSINFCTHRGYHPDAERYTTESLRIHQMEFDKQIFLNPYKIPDKMQHLRETLKLDNLMLIDDNPFFDKDFKEYDKAIYLVDKPWNKHYAFGDNRIYDDSVILEKITESLKLISSIP